MELVPRYELQLECRGVGRNLITEVVQNGPDLTDEAMDEIFEPLITSIEDKTHQALETQLDEFRGQMEDAHGEEAVRNLIDERRAKISESVIYSLNGDSPKMVSAWSLPKKNTKYVQRIINTARNDINTVDDNELLMFDEKDPHWISYMDHCTILINDQHVLFLYNVQQGYNQINEIWEYCMLHSITTDKLIEYIEGIEEAGMYINSVFQYIKTCRYPPVTKACRMAIRRGIRRGQTCGRTIYLNGKCKYHHGK